MATGEKVINRGIFPEHLEDMVHPTTEEHFLNFEHYIVKNYKEPLVIPTLAALKDEIRIELDKKGDAYSIEQLTSLAIQRMPQIKQFVENENDQRKAAYEEYANKFKEEWSKDPSHKTSTDYLSISETAERLYFKFTSGTLIDPNKKEEAVTGEKYLAIDEFQPIAPLSTIDSITTKLLNDSIAANAMDSNIPILSGDTLSNKASAEFNKLKVTYEQDLKNRNTDYVKYTEEYNSRIEAAQQDQDNKVIGDREPLIVNSAAVVTLGATVALGRKDSKNYGKQFNNSVSELTGLIESNAAIAKTALPNSPELAEANLQIENGLNALQVLAGIAPKTGVEYFVSGARTAGESVKDFFKGCAVSDVAGIALTGSDFIYAPEGRREILESDDFIHSLLVREGVLCATGGALLKGSKVVLMPIRKL